MKGYNFSRLKLLNESGSAPRRRTPRFFESIVPALFLISFVMIFSRFDLVCCVHLLGKVPTGNCNLECFVFTQNYLVMNLDFTEAPIIG